MVFREVLHKNKKVLKSKIKNTNVTDLKTTKTMYYWADLGFAVQGGANFVVSGWDPWVMCPTIQMEAIWAVLLVQQCRGIIVLRFMNCRRMGILGTDLLSPFVLEHWKPIFS